MSWNSWRQGLAALLLIPALALAGCGSDEPEEKAAEQAAEDALGGDVDIEDDELTVTDDDGSSSTIGTKLPEDFPVDDVPLLDGEILSATAVDGASFMVMMQVEGVPEDVLADAVQVLEDDGGFSGEVQEVAEGYSTGQLTKSGFDVALNAVGSEGGTQLQYVVTVG